MKKILIRIICCFSIYYTVYALSGAFFDKGIYFLFKQDFDLPEKVTFLTKRGQLIFSKESKNKYCFFSTCAFIEDMWNDTLILSWEKQKKSTFIKKKDVYVQKELLQRPDITAPEELTFSLKEDKESLKSVSCTVEKGCVQKEETKSDEPALELLSGSKVYQEQTGYRADTIQSSDILLFKQTGDYKLYKRLKNDAFLKIEPAVKSPRFLLALSSYNRPVYLSGQVLRLMKQTYQNFHLSLSIKGEEQAYEKITYHKEWQNFLKENRLSIRYDKNAGQFHNLLNAFRYQDLTQFDYVCKIDDDDWYSPDYLEQMRWHLMAYPDTVLIQQRFFHKLERRGDSVVFLNQAQPATGSTMCFKASFAQKLLDVENMSDTEISKLLLKDTTLTAPYKVALEDLLIAELARAQGKTLSLTTFQPTYLYNMTTASITRIGEE